MLRVIPCASAARLGNPRLIPKYTNDVGTSEIVLLALRRFAREPIAEIFDVSPLKKWVRCCLPGVVL